MKKSRDELSQIFPFFSFSSSSVQSVEGSSGAAKVVNLKPQVVSRPSGSLGVEVVSLLSRGATSTDSKVLKAVMVMQSCYNSDSTMTVRQLVEVQERFCILVEYKLHVLLSGQRPYDAFLDGKLTSYSCFADMFNLMKVKKSAGHAASRPAPPPPTEVLVEATREHPAPGGEKRPSRGGSNGGCGVPDRPPTVRELGEVDDQAGKDLYFIAQMSKLLGLKAEDPLKSCWPNLANSTRVTDGSVTAEYVRGVLHPSLVKQLTGPEAMAAAERRATELSTKVEQLKATLGESEQCRMDLELAVDSARVELRDLWYSQH
ncbi:hypothetical protein GW17_00040818 [Ensete ventricosum]|nr:hypothetical protein GW17_00040818 [Ensete ventricosum]